MVSSGIPSVPNLSADSSENSPGGGAAFGLSPAEVRALDTAFHLAQQAGQGGDVPVGAVVLTPEGIVAGLGLNQRECPPYDPSAHAEIVALREAAGRLERWNLKGCTLSLIHISEPTRRDWLSRMPSSA